MKYVISERQYKLITENYITENASKIAKIIVYVLPIAQIPKIIYYIYNGKYENVFQKLREFKSKIESELKSANITATIEDIVSEFKSIKDQLYSYLVAKSPSNEKEQSMAESRYKKKF